MFERYTEKARRAIFFARYEASQLGSPYIRTEHLLLGVLRESRELQVYLKVDAVKLAERLQSQIVGEKVATSVDLPLDDSCKRVLAHAAEEAERLNDRHIGSEHLLLGIMREERGWAAQVLREMGAATVADVRKAIADAPPTAALLGMGRIGTGTSRIPAVVVVDEETGRELSVVPRSQFAPRIGETIVIARSGASERFLVIDVQWKLMEGGQADELVQTGVEVRVRKEPDTNK
jgi:hypothetical protein